MLTREELKSKCEALAEVGDAQAIATLELFKEIDNLRSGVDKVIGKIDDVLATAAKIVPELEKVDPAVWKTQPGQVAGRKINGMGV